MAGIERYRNKTKISYNIGDIGPSGGFIFITPTTDGNETGRYFEAAPYGWNTGDDPTRPWAEIPYIDQPVSGADGNDIGTGYQNTLDIIKQGNADPANSAAALARSCNSGGYSDWFLPSTFELSYLYTNLTSYGIGGFVQEPYWGSSEIGPTTANAVGYFDPFNAPTKDMFFRVRPVRSFLVEYSSSTQRTGNDSVYGGGQDGDVVISSNISITRDMYYNNLTVNNGFHLNTNGFKIFVKNSLKLYGSIGVTQSNTVSTGTVSGHLPLGAGNISASIGGNSGGNTYIASQISASDRSNIESLISGVVFSTSGTITSIKGGASGANGANGIVTPATSGGSGTLSRNPLVAGGPGTAGTTPPASAGGAGGQGGPVVLVCSRVIVGNGSIVSVGKNASVGENSSTGSPGSAAPNATLTHLVDGSAHYITGDGTSGPHASVTAPNLPHGGHVPTTQNPIHGYTYRYVHVGNVHHTNNNVYGTQHNNHGYAAATPFAHHYGDFNNAAHVDSLTGTYFAINGIPHVYSHRPHTGVAYSGDYSHYSGNFNNTNDTPHYSYFVPAADGWKVHFPAEHVHQAYPRHHHDNNHAHFRARNAGTVSSQGSNTYPGGSAGLAGSSTAGSDGITGGGGGIIIVTDSIDNTIVTSTTGGTVSGGGAGQSGTVLTILNK